MNHPELNITTLVIHLHVEPMLFVKKGIALALVPAFRNTLETPTLRVNQSVLLIKTVQERKHVPIINAWIPVLEFVVTMLSVLL